LRRSSSLWLGLTCLIAAAGVFAWIRDARAAAEAKVSAIILPANPVVSVLDTVPVAINVSTGSVLVHIGTSWVQVPQGADAFAVSSSDAVKAVLSEARASEGTLRSGMTAAISASPTSSGRTAMEANSGRDSVRVLVEFN
jgi:hypothetical protein